MLRVSVILNADQENRNPGPARRFKSLGSSWWKTKVRLYHKADLSWVTICPSAVFKWGNGVCLAHHMGWE